MGFKDMEATIATYVTPEEYLAQEEQALYKSEYHDGVIIPMAGAQPRHNYIEGNVYRLLATALLDSYDVFTSNVPVYIPAINWYVYPDVTVVAGDAVWHTELPIGTVLNPCLIVEVLSASTTSYDRGDKFAGYQTIPTFREYLLIDQDRIAVTHWHRTDTGNWEYTDYTSREDVIALVSVPAQLPVAQVYRRVVLG